MACVCNRTIARQLANPQFSSVPRHLRMLPASPGEMPAIGTDSRKRVEVITAAVFVHAGARIDSRRDGIRHFSVGRTADNRDSAGFIWTALEPVQFATRKMEFAEPNAG